MEVTKQDICRQKEREGVGWQHCRLVQSYKSRITQQKTEPNEIRQSKHHTPTGAEQVDNDKRYYTVHCSY